jgi:hypothetical protein
VWKCKILRNKITIFLLVIQHYSSHMKIDMLRFNSCSDKSQIIRSRWLLTFDNSFKTSAKGVWFCSVLIIVSKCVKSRCHFLYLMDFHLSAQLEIA